MEIFKDLFPLEDRWGKDGVFTPTNIVKDMIDLLPDSIWNPESTFIDISCKTGAFLAEIYTRLDTELSKLDEYKDLVKRRSHILNNQLFGLALCNDESLFFSRRNVFGDPFSDNIDVINAGNSSYLDLVKQKQYSIIETQLKGKFGRMKFDVVVGNPPYNNDLYIPFVKLGKYISNQYILMITPAKWQGKDDKDNKFIRNEIEKHSSKVVYYQDARELFDIAEIDGIQYYLIDKLSTYNTQIIINKFRGSENSKVRRICGVLNNNAYKIIEKLCNFNKIVVDYNSNHYKLKKSEIDEALYDFQSRDNCRLLKIYSSSKVLDGMIPISIVHANKHDIDRYRVIQNEMLGYSFFYDKDGKIIGSPDYKILSPDIVCTSHYCVYRSFNNLDEAQSMLSYLNTKLVRFLTSMTLTGTTTQKKEFWRFVPDPGNFDHIFTDEELYKKYSLTDDEISLIESVIKERK